MIRLIPIAALGILAGCATTPAPTLPLMPALTEEAVPAPAPAPVMVLAEQGDPLAGDGAMRQRLAAFQRSNDILREANELLIAQVAELQATVDRLHSRKESSPESEQALAALRRQVEDLRRELALAKTPAPARRVAVPAVVPRSSAPLPGGSSAEQDLARLRALAAGEGGRVTSAPAPAGKQRFDVLYRFTDARRRDDFYSILGSKGVVERAKGTGAAGEHYVFVGSYSTEKAAIARVHDLERLLNVAGAVIVSR